MAANEIGSEAWCAAMSEVLKDLELPEVRATVEQRIGDGNGGSVVAYRLVIDGGRAHLAPVPPEAVGAVGSDSKGEGISDGGVVVMSQSRSTAEAVRRGELGALAALQAGLITVSGDVRVLMAASEALALVNAVLGAALTGDHHSAGGAPSNSADDPDGPHGDDGTEG